MNSPLSLATSKAKESGGATARPDRPCSHVVIRASRSISSCTPRSRAACASGPAANPEEFGTPVRCGSCSDTKGCGTHVGELSRREKTSTYGHSGSWMLSCGKPGRAR